MKPVPRFLRNARILTLDPARPIVSAMVVHRGRVVWVGDGEPTSEFADKSTLVEDLREAVVMPGFVDPHCHPLALGSALLKVDCGPGAISTIRELGAALHKAQATAKGRWIRGFGYDDLQLVEPRHPTRHDLDAAVPDRPVCLEHASGHALVLNSVALSELGIDASSDEPPGSTIDREPSTGEPTGLILEMNDWVLRHIPRSEWLSDRLLAKSASQALLEVGVTSVTDAGFRNGAEKLGRYREWRSTGDFSPRAAVMLAPEAWPLTCEGDSQVGVDCAKLVFTASSGRVSPTVEEAVERLMHALQAGAPGLAIHAVEPECIAAAADVLERLGQAARIKRVEHASECSPFLSRRLRDLGATVVTQPGFLFTRGDRYLAAPDVDLANLYPLRRWLHLGLKVAGSSDAPFGPVNPLVAISAALNRTARSGQCIGHDQAIGLVEALALYGPNAAAASGDRAAGSLKPGALADFVVLDADPIRVSPQELAEIRVLRTAIGGETVWERG